MALLELSVALAILAIAMAVTWPRWTVAAGRAVDDEAHRQSIDRRRHAFMSDAE